MLGGGSGAWRRRALQGVRRTLARRWSSTGKPPAGAGGAEGSAPTQQSVTASTRRATPGTVRVRRTFNAKTEEAEMDSTMARIIGSDWGDRSRQPVSLAMRFYWIVFGVVLLNGLYTTVVGKDESYFVNKFSKLVDSKMGVAQAEELDVNAHDAEKQAQKRASVQTAKTKANATATPSPSPEASVPAAATTSAPPSMLNPSAASSGLPFFAPPSMVSAANPKLPQSKQELEQELAKLRLQEKQLNLKILTMKPTGEELEELERQLRVIEARKVKVKRMIKRL